MHMSSVLQSYTGKHHSFFACEACVLCNADGNIITFQLLEAN